MFNLEERKVYFLKILIDNEFTTTKQIENELNISDKTVAKEVEEINTGFDKDKRNLQVIFIKGKGYKLQVNDNTDVKNFYQLIHEVNILSENTLLIKTNFQIINMLWNIVLSTDYIKSYDLMNHFNISHSTLTNYLKTIRSILFQYELSIESVPYYGLIVKGNFHARMSCLLDYCDYYSDYKKPFFRQQALSFLDCNIFKLKKIKTQLVDFIKACNLCLSERGYRNLTLWIILLDKYDETLIPNTQDVNLILPMIQTKTEEFFKKISDVSFLNQSEKKYQNFLTGLLSMLDITVKMETILNQNGEKQIDILYTELNKQFIQENNLDLSSHTLIEVYTKNAILKSYIRSRNNIFTHNIYVSEKAIIRSISGSRTLALMILNKFGYHIDQFIINDLSVGLYNVIINIPNIYLKTNILVVNTFNQSALASVKNKLSLDKYNVNLETISPTELAYVNLKKYDFILDFENPQYNQKDLPIESISIDYFIDGNSKKDIWEKLIINKRQISFIDIKNAEIVNISYKMKKGETLATIIYHTLLKQNMIENKDIIEQIEQLVAHAYFEDNQKYYTIIIYDNRIKRQQNYFISLQVNKDYPFDYPEKILLIILPLQSSYLTVKQTDSLIRRIQNGTIKLDEFYK